MLDYDLGLWHRSQEQIVRWLASVIPGSRVNIGTLDVYMARLQAHGYQSGRDDLMRTEGYLAVNHMICTTIGLRRFTLRFGLCVSRAIDGIAGPRYPGDSTGFGNNWEEVFLCRPSLSSIGRVDGSEW